MLPETSEDIALKYLARYLKAQRLQQYLHPSPFRSPMHKKHSMQLDRQKQRELLEALKKTALENLRRQQKLRTWPRHYHHQYNPINDIMSGQDYLMNYYNLGLKLDYPEMKSSEDDSQSYGDNLEYGQPFPDADRDAVAELDFHGKWMEGNHAIVLHEGGRENTARPAAIGEAMVTYRFDKPNLQEKHPFAVKPNDPRYYSDAPFSSGEYIYFMYIYKYTTI